MLVALVTVLDLSVTQFMGGLLAWQSPFPMDSWGVFKGTVFGLIIGFVPAA
jgi:hypothetical protein